MNPLKGKRAWIEIVRDELMQIYEAVWPEDHAYVLWREMLEPDIGGEG